MRQYNDDLQEFFGNGGDDKASSKSKTKGMQARFLVEMLAVDQDLTRDLMDTYSKILEGTSLPDSSKVKTFADYLPFRVANSGLEYASLLFLS